MGTTHPDCLLTPSSKPEGRVGLLTDGNSWDFHYIKLVDDGFELFRAPRITTSTEDNIQLVLGITVA